jgi:hypothetical protein
MSKHPIFLSIDKKLKDSGASLEHVRKGHAQELWLQRNHASLYSPSIHADALVTDIQAL